VVLWYLTPTAPFSPLCRAFCAVVFFRGGAYFCGIGLAAVLVFRWLRHAPQSLGGFRFRGAGVV